VGYGASDITPPPRGRDDDEALQSGRSRQLEFGGWSRHASNDEPQYEIKSDKTDHIAMHKGSALTKISR
jgi:hypothetical protein